MDRRHVHPVTGCTEVSPGCDHCYAKTFAERWRGTPGHYFEHGFDVQLRPEKLALPLRWRKPRKVFVNSMSDLFHDAVPDEYIARVFAVMAATPQHTYQVLTKRHGRMRSLLNDPEFRHQVYDMAGDYDRLGVFDPFRYAVVSMIPTHYAAPQGQREDDSDWWPLPNVWLGVSVENQQWADIRIPALLDTPAAVRFLSCEPLIGPVDLRPYLSGDCPRCGRDVTTEPCGTLHANMACDDTAAGIAWVIVGGESGHDARPMHPDWARSLRDQCAAANVPFLFKQWGEHLPVRLFNDERMAGGRAFRNPKGGTSAAWIIARGPSGTFRSAVGRPMRPGDRTKGGVVMLDEDTVAVRVGKGNAGRELDGRTHDEFPRPPETDLDGV